MLRPTMVVVASLGLLLAGHMSLQVGRQALIWAAHEPGERPVTIGVIGDMPYRSRQAAAFQGFMNAVCSDRVSSASYTSATPSRAAAPAMKNR